MKLLTEQKEVTVKIVTTYVTGYCFRDGNPVQFREVIFSGCSKAAAQNYLRSKRGDPDVVVTSVERECSTWTCPLETFLSNATQVEGPTLTDESE